ncbi:MAG TPA: glycosyltransferase family 87 protein, partial [Phycisphaerales bacterium]|nr:glycosyltransferase family 87 protein [Phycisphaerales bacterium]
MSERSSSGDPPRPARSGDHARARAAGGHPGVGIRPTWEPWLVGLLAVLAIGFGVLVEHRSVFSERRRTDAGVFFRAGYAWRAGLDPYAVPDDNDWFFLYPPGIAPAFGPLADPPPPQPNPTPSAASDGQPPAPIPPPAIGWHAPYPASIALWYALGVACAVVSVESLARALLRGSPDPSVRAMGPGRGGWWGVRVWPLLMVLPDVCSTLSRGQINLLILACVSVGICLLARARWFWGGFLVSLAACIKVLPGILVFDVLTRRGSRAIAGYLACGVVMMAAVPVVCYGPARAYELTREWGERVLLAGVLGTKDRLQAGSGFEDTDNLSIQGSLHNLVNIATPRGQRPAEPAAWVKIVHLAVGLGLTFATVWIGRRSLRAWMEPARDSTVEITLRIGMFMCVMLMAAPMCHRHYFVMLLPAVSALVFVNLMRSRLAVPNGWGALLIPLYPAVMTLPRLAEEGTLKNMPHWIASAMTTLSV